MRWDRLLAWCAVAALAAGLAVAGEGATTIERAGAAANERAVPVIHGTSGTVMHLQYMADQTYFVTTAVGSLTQIDFPAGEHVQHVVVSENPAVRAEQVGDTVQISPMRADAVSGVNIITTRGTYRMQIASTHDSTQSTGFVHFGLPGAEQ